MNLETVAYSLLSAGVLAVALGMMYHKLLPRPVEAGAAATLLGGWTLLTVSWYLAWRLDWVNASTIGALLPFQNWHIEWLWVFAFAAAWLSAQFWQGVFRVLQGLSGALLLVVLLTTLLHAAGYPLRKELLVYSYQDYYRPHGLLATPLEVGLLGLIAWGWGLVWSVQSGWRRPTGLMLTGVSAAVVYLTLTRSTWLGLALGVGLGVLLAWRQRRLWLPLGLTVGVFVLASLALPLGWGRSAYATQGDPSVQNRLTLWKLAPAVMLRHPFGEPRVPVRFLEPDEPYIGCSTVNFYLDVGVQYGVLPFALMLWFTGALAYRAWRWAQAGQAGWGLATLGTLVCLGFMGPDPVASALMGGLWGWIGGEKTLLLSPTR